MTKKDNEIAEKDQRIAELEAQLAEKKQVNKISFNNAAAYFGA